MDVFDLVIPVGPNDTKIIYKQIEYTKKNIIGYRNIYIVTNNILNIEGCITISENIFPFTIETIEYHHGKRKRSGWYLQQLLKLYAGKIIPDILDRYLVIDADTFFVRPTTFYLDGKCLYNYGTEYHIPYFEHMKALSQCLTKQDNQKSGICHHMMFETKYIDELFDMVETNHNDKFYNIFLKNVNPQNYERSGASEYEIYFNYMSYKHPDKITIRELSWANLNCLRDIDMYDYISVHWYARFDSYPY
jgi:hypothetical protein